MEFLLKSILPKASNLWPLRSLSQYYKSQKSGNQKVVKPTPMIDDLQFFWKDLFFYITRKFTWTEFDNQSTKDVERHPWSLIHMTFKTNFCVIPRFLFLLTSWKMISGNFPVLLWPVWMPRCKIIGTSYATTKRHSGYFQWAMLLMEEILPVPPGHVGCIKACK